MYPYRQALYLRAVGTKFKKWKWAMTMLELRSRKIDADPVPIPIRNTAGNWCFAALY